MSFRPNYPDWLARSVDESDAALENDNGGSIPSGGLTAQALVKASNADGDVAWGAPGSPTLIPAFLAGLDLHDAQTYGLNFDTAFDNLYDFNTLTELPDGIGLTFPLDGSDSLWMTTEAGVWFVELTLQLNADATVSGDVALDLMLGGPPLFGPGITNGPGNTPPTYRIQQVLDLPEAAQFEFQIHIYDAATANPYTCFPTAIVARIG